MDKHLKIGGWIFDHCLPMCAMSPSSIIIHHSVFTTTGDFDEALPACEDYDLWLHLALKGAANSWAKSWPIFRTGGASAQPP